MASCFFPESKSSNAALCVFISRTVSVFLFVHDTHRFRTTGPTDLTLPDLTVSLKVTKRLLLQIDTRRCIVFILHFCVEMPPHLSSSVTSLSGIRRRMTCRSSSQNDPLLLRVARGEGLNLTLQFSICPSRSRTDASLAHAPSWTLHG